MLLIACGVIVASLVLSVRDDEKVGFAGYSQLVLPPMCMAREWFGVSCPGCGLTRSFIFLAHGDFQASWHVHHLGWILACATLLQIPYRVYSLRHPGKSVLSHRAKQWIAQILIGLLIANWVMGILFTGS